MARGEKRSVRARASQIPDELFQLTASNCQLTLPLRCRPRAEKSKYKVGARVIGMLRNA